MIIMTFIEIALSWLRDVFLSILGRHAEEFFTKHVKRKRRKRKTGNHRGKKPAAGAAG
jgi:hypothetical protein